MASLKSNPAGKRRITVNEKEHRESSRSRASGHSRDVSKSRNDRPLINENPRTQEKHRSSSREASRQTARTTNSSRETARDLEEKSRTTKRVTEIKLAKDPITLSRTKLSDSKLSSKKAESIISSSNTATKESNSKSKSSSRSTQGENVKAAHLALNASRRSVKENTKNKSGNLETNELSMKGKILASRYPTFDIEKDEQSDVEEDYPDDFENYDSDFEESSGQDEEIEEKNNQDSASVHSSTDIYQPKTIQSHAPPLRVTDISETQLEPMTTLTNPIITRKKEQETVQNQLLSQESTSIFEKKNVEQIVEEDKSSLPKHSSQSYINFKAAKQNVQTQKVTNKIKKRGDVLLDLITLDETSINLFSLSPTAYDEFMVTFGGTNTKQAYIQTGDDNVLEESQTDTIEMLDLWTQYPPYIGGAIGGEFMSKISKPVEATSIKDWKHLSHFLNVASRVICNILEEEQVESSNIMDKGNKSKYDFSDRGTVSFIPAMLKSDYDFNIANTTYLQHFFPKSEGFSIVGICSASSITCSKLQPHILLSVCEELPMNKDDDSCCNQKLICVWNIFQPASPQKLLMCRYAMPICCCLDDQANFAFAGMDDASVALWDLREPDSLHERKAYADNQWSSLRTPTYSTAGINAAECHTSSVIAMHCQQDSCSSNNLTNKSFENQNSQGIIQLATLDEEARIFIWVVTELSQPVIDWEHGLSPNGHVKLAKSSVINLQTLPFAQQHLKTHPRSLGFINDPNDSSIFYVAIDTGIVISCSLYGGKCNVYGHSLGYSSKAMSVAFLPMGKPSCFLAGYHDGSIVLYNAKKENALMIWKADDSIEVVKVQWSKSSPNIFYALHGNGKLCIWDLKRNDRKPVSSILRKSKRITGFDVGNDKRVQNSFVANYQPLIVIGHDDGTVEAHYLTSQYSRTGPEEMEFFIKYVEFL